MENVSLGEIFWIHDGKRQNGAKMRAKEKILQILVTLQCVICDKFRMKQD